MADVVALLLWIVGLVVAVVMIVAQCQLFAIRRLLEALVKQSASAQGAAQPSVAGDPDECNIPGPLPAGGNPIAAPDKKIVWIVAAVMLALAILTWAMFIRQ